jgi:hypothetical protein
MVASSRAMTRHLLFVITIGVASVAAQDSPRQIWDSGFRQKRPAPSAKPSTSAPPTTPDYRVAAGPAPVTTAGARLVGFTLWRLRRAVDGDTTPRLLVQDSGPGPEELVPERISPGESLAVGDRIRLGFEVAQRGYLYVIDRERYTDGSRGAPYLLFPARNLRGGDNRVEPGRLIEIPAQGDDVPALRVRRSESRHVGEELTVLVTEKPVDGIVLGEGDTKLPEDVVRRRHTQAGSRCIACSVGLDRLRKELGTGPAPLDPGRSLTSGAVPGTAERRRHLGADSALRALSRSSHGS